MNSFLVTTCWIYQKHELKVFRCISNNGILTQLNYWLCRTGDNLTSFYSKLLIINNEKNYWKILDIKVNHVHYINGEKWCLSFHQSQHAVMSDRHKFFFLVYRIGDWSSTGKYVGLTYQHISKEKKSMLQV